MLDKHLVITGITRCCGCGNIGSSVLYKRYRKVYFPTISESVFYDMVEQNYFDLESLLLKSTDFAYVRCPRCNEKMYFSSIYDIKVEEDVDAPPIFQKSLKCIDDEFKKQGIE